MLKAQDLHIKHLYAIDEEQQDSSMSSSDGPLEITVNEMNTRENRGWYRGQRELVSSHKTRMKHPDQQITTTKR